MSEEISRKVASGRELHENPESVNPKSAHELVDDGQSRHNMKKLKPRSSGIPGVGDIRWGEHLCIFYNGKQELLKLVASFIATGLRDNEFCMWITGEPVTERDAIEMLESVFPQAHECLIQKQLEILPHQEWYLPSGAFNEERLLENWVSKARYAEAKGFAGIRITGNPFWLHYEEEWAQFDCYEKTLEASIQTERVLALCTYPIERCSQQHISQIFSSHGSTLLKNNGEWQRLELSRPND